MTPKEREALKQKKLRIKDKFENNNMGDYQNLYPLKRGVTKHDDRLMDQYDLIIARAKDVYEESTGATKIVAKKPAQEVKGAEEKNLGTHKKR